MKLLGDGWSAATGGNDPIQSHTLHADTLPALQTPAWRHFSHTDPTPLALPEILYELVHGHDPQCQWSP